LVMEMKRRKLDVIPLDIKPNLWDKRINRATVIQDLRKPLHKMRLRKTPDTIIHLAAIARVHDLVVKPELAMHNYLMTHNLLEYARERGIKEFVFASSREVYGESKVGIKRKESDTHVSWIKSPYTASKFASESLIHSYGECYDMNPVIVRLSNVYGRYDISERVIPLFIYYALRNRHITVFGREKELDFTFVDDTVDGFIKIVQRYKKVGGRTFNLSSGKGEKLLTLAEMIIAALNSKSTLSSINKRVGEISSYTGDISLAKRLLGYKPKVFLKEGVKANIDWYCRVTAERRISEIQRRNLAKRGWA
ncbi:MAG: NAD-dependent epimerase/dehydratase family protein, partial [bacterium]|nr:NAD-dependent epimerase/dehydratase family protein [bacterium]